MSFLDRFRKQPPPIPSCLQSGESQTLRGELIGRESTNGTLSISIISTVYQKESKCAAICPETENCVFAKFGNNPGRTTFETTEIVISIANLSDDFHYIAFNDFSCVDENGFVHQSVQFCERYAYPNCGKSANLPPKSKIKCSVYFPTITDSIARLVYDGKKAIIVGVDIDPVTIDDFKTSKIKEQAQEIERLNEEIKAIRQEAQLQSRSLREGSQIRFEVIDSDEWYRIISKEEDHTVSFNREFDKSKENYNWINIGDPLITMRIDNVSLASQIPTKISSPVSGIFEFDSNKLIGFDKEICRIRKIDMLKKQETIDAYHCEDIRQAVLKRERKKMIERQTLDRLIDEGLVFNVTASKSGSRKTIPMDIANAVWNRDGGRCCICGSRKELEFDHIIPVSKGGATTFRNLQLLCHSCNVKKSDNI